MAPREENADPATPSSQGPNSAWSPFRHKTFAVIWTATVISNIGGWMYSAASGWLMTSLNPSPLIVSMVQVATSLPYCLFALPAGALADIVDRRKLLVFGEVVTIVFSSALAALVLLHRVTPLNLLLLYIPNRGGLCRRRARLASSRSTARSEIGFGCSGVRQQRRHQRQPGRRSRA